MALPGATGPPAAGLGPAVGAGGGRAQARHGDGPPGPSPATVARRALQPGRPGPAAVARSEVAGVVRSVTGRGAGEGPAAPEGGQEASLSGEDLWKGLPGEPGL